MVAQLVERCNRRRESWLHLESLQEINRLLLDALGGLPLLRVCEILCVQFVECGFEII